MDATFTVLFDANVFFGAALRSLIVQLAGNGLFRARWSSAIHEEWTKAVLAQRPGIDPDRLRGVAAQMDRAVPECLVTGHEPIISSLLLPDPGDRHVLAAAIASRADCLVTFNERDFPRETLQPFHIHTSHPDRFLMDIDRLGDGALMAAAREDFAHYKRPPLSVDAYIERFRKAGVPNTADYMQRMQVLLQP